MLSLRKTAAGAVVQVALPVLLVAVFCLGCSTESKIPTLELSWEQDQGTWNLNEPDASMQISVKNLGEKDQWVTVMAFENDCFKCEGFGSWSDGWEESGKIPADGKEHTIQVNFKPLSACPATDFNFYAESRKSPGQKAFTINFSTNDAVHLGTKTFRVATATPAREPVAEVMEKPVEEIAKQAGQE